MHPSTKSLPSAPCFVFSQSGAEQTSHLFVYLTAASPDCPPEGGCCNICVAFILLSFRIMHRAKALPVCSLYICLSLPYYSVGNGWLQTPKFRTSGPELSPLSSRLVCCAAVANGYRARSQPGMFSCCLAAGGPPYRRGPRRR